MGRRNNDRRGRQSSAGREPESVTARAILDRFTSVDELLEDTNQALQQIAQTQQALATAIDDSTETELELPGELISSEYPFDFSTLVPEFPGAEPNSPLTEVFESPFDGTLTEVLIGYPSGTQQAVGVGVEGPDGERLVPRGPAGSQFVAFNDEVLRFELNEPLQKNEQVTIKYANNDDEQDHFVNVILKVREDV